MPTESIGYGTYSTLLQMANAYAALANGGVVVDPVLVRGTVGGDGTLEATAAPAERRVVSEVTAAQVIDMLGQAMDGDGATGTRARIPGYRIGGKTGTAIKVSASGGYAEGEYVSTFVGVAPLEDPRIVVAVMVDDPQGDYYGGLVAAPAFREVMHASLLARRIVPDSEGQPLAQVVEATRDAAAEYEAMRAAALAVERAAAEQAAAERDTAGD